jgi:hypothetical protein
MKKIIKFFYFFFSISILYGLTSHFLAENKKVVSFLDKNPKVISNDQLAKDYLDNLFKEISSNKEKKEDIELGINFLKSRLQMYDINDTVKKEQNFPDNKEIIQPPKSQITDKTVISTKSLSESTNKKFSTHAKSLNKKSEKSELYVKKDNVKNSDKEGLKKSKKDLNEVTDKKNYQQLITQNSQQTKYKDFYKNFETSSVSNDKIIKDKFAKIQLVQSERIKKLNEEF